ncbi:hypothetical protein CALVIDRAFT_601448 [Calocera viscosa TUFC12733]|uniref:Uncharacterized protein n=1 Tax=Calocera viscosa (strain TUFC12733) TaxID=1330018 RepID=A0A167IA34_CALVF|nr:hypothetical protein CALVIDRAFT_601448 [Calocera viscosa TUFC12733]
MAPRTTANTAHGKQLLQIVRRAFGHVLRRKRTIYVGCGSGERRERIVGGKLHIAFFDFDSYRDMLTGFAGKSAPSDAVKREIILMRGVQRWERGSIVSYSGTQAN